MRSSYHKTASLSKTFHWCTICPSVCVYLYLCTYLRPIVHLVSICRWRHLLRMRKKLQKNCVQQQQLKSFFFGTMPSDEKNLSFDLFVFSRVDYFRNLRIFIVSAATLLLLFDPNCYISISSQRSSFLLPSKSNL